MKAAGKHKIPNEYPHMVILTHDDNYILIPMKKAAMLVDEVVEWLDETFEEGAWEWYFGILSFRAKEDAMGFLLRWA